ncbi:MAG: hypothetical protein WAZ20_03580, partial [Methanothrix sp.]|uniref:hypothetical protein n=1 Tax=Methanothrix sp. TaxID=90426 RepID=UPI003BB57E61
EMPSKPGQSCLGLMPAGEDDHLRMEIQLRQQRIQPHEGSLPAIMDQKAEWPADLVSLMLLPRLQLKQMPEDIEACRICPGADYGNLPRSPNLQISLPISSISATIGA